MSFRLGPVVLHSAAAAAMAYGWLNLGNLVQDSWISKQKGGHMQFLTIQALMIACLTMVMSLILDLFPSITVLRQTKRAVFMIAMPMSVVVTSIYWTLLLWFPTLILQADPSKTVPTSSTEVPSLMRLPLRMDLALHAVPGVSLLLDFIFFERKYGEKEARYGATLMAALTGTVYGSLVEYFAKFNGSFPYPFLTENPFEIRVAIYFGATTFALVSFWIINALHP